MFVCLGFFSYRWRMKVTYGNLVPPVIFTNAISSISWTPKFLFSNCFKRFVCFINIITFVKTESWQNRQPETTPLNQKWLHLVLPNLFYLYSFKKSMDAFKRKKTYRKKIINTGKKNQKLHILCFPFETDNIIDRRKTTLKSLLRFFCWQQ